MTVRIVEGIAFCESAEVIIKDGQSALDFIADVGYRYKCGDFAVKKAAVCEEFFDLSTKVAGEVAQKAVNYHARIAIIGDFSGYQSKALRDYIYESNKHGPLYFVGDEDEAIARLSPHFPIDASPKK